MVVVGILSAQLVSLSLLLQCVVYFVFGTFVCLDFSVLYDIHHK